MNTYKITNVTDTAGKRDFKFNSPINIEYVNNMMKKTVTINPGKSLYLTVDNLPMSVHKLRIKKLVNVVEVSQSELESIKNENKPKSIAPVAFEMVAIEEVNAEENAKKSNKRKRE